MHEFIILWQKFFILFKELQLKKHLASETPASYSHVQPEHIESIDMTQVDTDKLNCKEEESSEGDAQIVDQKTQQPVVLVCQRKKRKLKTYPKFPETKKPVLVVPIFVEEKWAAQWTALKHQIVHVKLEKKLKQIHP